MCHSLFIHSSFDGHIGYFHVFALVECAAVNIRVQVIFSYTGLLFKRLIWDIQSLFNMDIHSIQMHLSVYKLPVFIKQDNFLHDFQ